jgi:NADH-quinone oxidoreductase subunit G
MPTLEIDGKEVAVEDGLNLIQAAERLDIEVPHYCYHPGLSISGNCRMCLVEIEKQPKLQIACNTRAAEGMVVHTASDKVQVAQQAVLEFLLLNHPIDCPICDQAGECKLQDYYMAYGRYSSRIAVQEKVEKHKVVDLGPLVVLDQERCILCARCTRFLDEVTKTSELGIFARGDRCHIDLFPNKRLDNPYSGNVVDVCPVGALTSKDFRFKARVWYLQKTESVCSACATGCNISIYHRRGTIYRFQPRYNPEVNQYWMCDYGRLAYKELLRESRLLKPLVRGEDGFTAVPWEEALTDVAEKLSKLKTQHGPSAVGGIVSARATNEEVYLFTRLLAETLGSNRVASLSWSPANSYHDDFLIKADKNPNTSGLQSLGVLNGRDNVGSILNQAKEGKIKALLLFAADLVGWLGKEEVEQALENLDLLVMLDTDHNETALYAEVILPIATFAETDGTFTNFTGRVQRIRQAFSPLGGVKTGWEALTALSVKLGGQGSYASSSDVFSEIAAKTPAFQGLSYSKIGFRGATLSGDEPSGSPSETQPANG